MSKFKLYHYWRSTCSWRVRWALAIKGIQCEWVAVNLLERDQTSKPHLSRNPMGLVPTLEWHEGGEKRFLSESTAIIEWLDKTHPKPALLPSEPFARAKVRQLAEVINAGTQPLQNLGVQNYHSDDAKKKKAWAQHWIARGLAAYEKLAIQTAGRFSYEDELGYADLFLIPQIYNAHRFEVALDSMPTISKIWGEVQSLSSYQQTEPSRFEPKA